MPGILSFLVMLGAGFASASASFVTAPAFLLAGPVAPRLVAVDVPRAVAYDQFKYFQTRVKTTDHARFREELDAGCDLLSFNKPDTYVSLFGDPDTHQHFFTIIYSVSDTTPRVYTIDGIIRTPGAKLTTSAESVLVMIEREALQKRGNTYTHGRRMRIEAMLERCLF